MTPEKIKEKFNIYFKNWVYDPNDKRLASEFMTDFALSIADELQREAFKAGLEARCGYSFTEEFIDKEFKKWKEKQQ
ncbi:MAG TPA: hypothetical protein PK914_07760 [Smithellaceae bacterium]|nr:hypothetical protein [Smithellaceae bacterium]